MRKLLGAMIAAATLAGTAQAVTYDPAAQGANAANFQYGYFSASSFTAYTFPADYATGGGCQITTGTASSCLQGGPSSFLGAYFTPVDGQANTAFLFASDVSLHPGDGVDELAALAFVAPTAGTYSFSGTLRGVDAPNGNGISYTLADGGTGILAPGGSLGFGFDRTLAAGEQAFFTVGNAGAFSFDTTGLQLSVTAVPEPATWAMMIGGFGLVGGSLRAPRRRKAALA